MFRHQSRHTFFTYKNPYKLPKLKKFHIFYPVFFLRIPGKTKNNNQPTTNNQPTNDSPAIRFHGSFSQPRCQGIILGYTAVTFGVYSSIDGDTSRRCLRNEPTNQGVGKVLPFGCWLVCDFCVGNQKNEQKNVE